MRLMRWKKQRSNKVTAHFYGGPLDKKGRYLNEYPPQYAFRYEATELATDVQTDKLALYDHQGNGVYLYQGSVNPGDTLYYDNGEQNAIK